MHCPYCTSEVNDAALVCPVCTRDLYLFKPLLQKIDALEKQLHDVATTSNKTFEERIARLEAELMALRSAPAVMTVAIPAAAKSDVSQQASPRSYIGSAIITLCMTLLLLLAAHGLIVIMYDLKPLYLRIASLLIPLPFGVALYVWHPRRFGLSLALALVTACAAVLGMSTVTSYVDKVPVLPENLRDWQEFIEYAASIGLSFITGLLLGKLRAVRTTSLNREPNRIVLFIAQLFTTHEDGELGLQKMIVRITKLVATLTPAASAAVSIYTGVKAFIGNS